MESVSSTTCTREDEESAGNSYMIAFDCANDEHSDHSASKMADDNSLTSIDEDVPYLLDSDSILDLATSPHVDGHVLSNNQDEEYQREAISLHSYSQTLPSISSDGLHNYSQPMSRALPPGNMDILHNYSQPWPQNTSCSTSVHNYCINNNANDQQKDDTVQTQEQLFKVAQPESNEPLCLKIRFTESYICHWSECSTTHNTVEALAEHANTHLVAESNGIWICRWLNCTRKLKPFDSRYKIVQHLRIHTSEKPHKCSLCLSEFTSVEGLTKHQRIHTGEKPYSCTFPGCTRAFKNSGDRFKHVRAHKVKFPYLCKHPGCDKKYTDPGSLRKHCRAQNHVTGTSGKQTKDANIVPLAHKIQTATLVPSAENEDVPQLAGVIVSSSVPPGKQILAFAPNSSSQGMTGTTSNPLLSSALMVSTATDCLYTVEVKDGCSSVQEAPLDLSTNIPEDCVIHNHGHQLTKWIDLDS